MTTTSTTLKTRRMVLCGLFSALIAIGAFIQIPVPYMDYFTLQFLFVVLAGMLLGPNQGSLSAAVYVAVGLAGLPIFAAGGGMQYILRPSFGYLMGFIAAAWLTGMICQKLRAKRFLQFLPAALSAMVITYLIGFTYKYFILNYYLGQHTPLIVILLSAFPLDLPGDIALSVVASILAARLKTALAREHLL